MRLKQLLTSYAVREDGAVTVDMVGIIAAVVAIGLGVSGTISSGTLDFAGALSDHIEAIEAGVTPGGSGGGDGGPGNPGNNADVGGAGEDPNASGDFGSGDRGQSR